MAAALTQKTTLTLFDLPCSRLLPFFCSKGQAKSQARSANSKLLARVTFLYMYAIWPYVHMKMLILTFATLTILATADIRSVDSASTLDELVHSMDEVFHSVDDLLQSWDDLHSMDEVCQSVDNFVHKWDKPVQTTNRTITLYEPGQSVNRALPMPHSEASNTEDPVPGADHERAWHIEVVYELTLACLGAVIGIGLVNTFFALWTDIYMYEYVYIRLAISGLFIMASVSSGILQFNSAFGGFVMSVCITYGIVTGIYTESKPVVYAARSPIRFV